MALIKIILSNSIDELDCALREVDDPGDVTSAVIEWLTSERAVLSVGDTIQIESLDDD